MLKLLPRGCAKLGVTNRGIVMAIMKTLISRNKLIIHAGVILFVTKALFTLLICSTTLIFLSDLYLLGTWVVVSLVMDALIFLTKPKLIFDFDLTESEQMRYRITSNELKRYLRLAPMARFVRTLLMTSLVLSLGAKTNVDSHLLISLTIGFIGVDPIIRKILDIVAPTIFNKIPAGEPFISDDIHRNNPAYIGSAAWNALESTRPMKNNF